MFGKYYHSNTFKERRLNLIALLREKGIDDERVLTVMSELPREKFVTPSFKNRSYDDTALPIDCDQTISQPYTVAFMTSILKVKENDKVLEIGTGSGYQAAILYLLGAKIFTVERINELYLKAIEIFREFNMNINCRLGDGTLGWQEFAPYQGIIVTAAAPRLPKTLMNQLAIGGKMVIPVGDKNTQTMYLVERISDSDYKESKNDHFKFVPLIGKEGWESE